MRLGATKASATTSYNGLGDQLYDLGGARPTLDLNFSSNESLVDSVTGKTLVDHTRASSATYVDGDGVIRTAVTNLVLQSEDFSTTWTRTGVLAFGSGSIVNAIAAPDGQVSADLITEDTSTGFHRIGQPFNYAANTVYMFSVYAKAETRSKLNLQLGSGLFKISLFDLTAGTATGDGVIQPVGNGWYRCSLFSSNTVSGASIAYVEITNDSDQRSYTGDGTSGIYLWGAQLEESSTVGQYVKTTTAINSAPRFDHDPETGESLGLLVEESRTNLLVRSEEFDQAAWDNALTPVTVTVNTETAPNGSTTADTLSNTANTSTEYRIVQSVTTSSQVAFSVYVKKGTHQFIQFRTNSVTSGFVNFDLDGVTASATTATGQIVDAGNGWRRCTAVFAAASITSVQIQFVSSASASRGETWTPAGTISVYLWGAQLEAGSFPTSYIPTEGSTVTRAADVTSITGRNFGSVNLLSYSEEFDQGSWVRSQGSVISNATSAPNGTITADQFIENTATSQHALLLSQTITANTTYTLSCYIKAANRSTGWVQFNNSTYSSGVRAIFNLSAATATAVNFGTGSGAVASIASAGDGWYRVSIRGVVDASSTTGVVAIYLNDGLNYAGDGTSGIYVWGAQLEEGSTATDYIKSDVNFTSRGSTATYYDVNGVIQTAAIDEARTAAYLPDGNGNFVSAGDLLLEGAGTNYVRNNTMVGAVAGTPGTNPTNWGYVTTQSNGLTQSIIGTGTENGINYIDYRFNGTTVASPNAIAFGFEGTAGVAATGQTWTGSIYLRLVNGTLTGVNTTQIGLIESTSGGGFVSGDLYTVSPPTSATLISQRGTATRTLSGGATVEICALTMNINVAGSTDIDFTLRIGMPQLEQNAFATSVIPTSGSTATRAADVSLSSSNTFGNSFYDQEKVTFYTQWYNNVERNWTNYQAIAGLENSNGINAINVSTNGGNGYQIYWNAKDNNVNQLDYSAYSIGYPKVSIGTFSHAVAATTDDAAFAALGNSVGTDSSITMPTVNKLVFNAPVHIKRFTLWPERLSNDTLQTITV
jgi:hypothetical protein